MVIQPYIDDQFSKAMLHLVGLSWGYWRIPWILDNGILENHAILLRYVECNDLNLNYSLVEPLNTQELCDVTNGQVGYCPLNRESSCAPPPYSDVPPGSQLLLGLSTYVRSHVNILQIPVRLQVPSSTYRQNEIAYPGTYKFLFDSNLFLYFITTAEQYNT